MSVRISEESLNKTITITSSLLWVPQSLVLLYMALDQEYSTQVVTLLFLTVTIATTIILATRFEHGEWLMAFSCLVGIVSEVYSLGSGLSSFGVSRHVWVLAAAAHGLFGGILCKAKDVQDGKHFKHHTIAERLYMVIPFVIGQWTGLIFNNGWSAILSVFSTIFLCLSTVGYGVVAYRMLDHFGVLTGDLIGLVAKLFTTSFGVVFGVLFLFVSILVYLAIPFLDALLSLNALISSAGIVVEILVYDYS